MAIWRTPDGLEVAVTVVNNRPCLRISRWHDGLHTFIGYCPDVRELAKLVNLAELVLV
ncbi:hypothetical protein [Streptosporangium sp. KLBMP 9127]|nr:hypothetical protein [Streptosporangium sp. KLBMP 9127]